MKTIFSGIQPTGNFHIGNYLGAVQNWVTLQNDPDVQSIIFIADYHSLTSNRDARERREYILKAAIELIAAGIDPDNTILFVQSHVPEHTELAWVFNTVTPFAELERMTQFKDKSQSQTQNINAGLLTYPTLQAADILLYSPTHIPVGRDQVQHVELTRDIARWFNNRYGEQFQEPEVLFAETPKVMSLIHPEKKMSKSGGSGNAIDMADEPEIIAKKLKKAVTASEGGGASPGAENLLLLLKHFCDDKKQVAAFEAAEKDGTIRYGDLKSLLASSIADHFADFREKRAKLMENHNMVAEALIDGASKAQAIASKTMEEVRVKVGIR